MFGVHNLAILKYSATAVTGIAGLCGIWFASSDSKKHKRGRQDWIVLGLTALSLLIAIMAQVGEQISDDAAHEAALKQSKAALEQSEAEANQSAKRLTAEMLLAKSLDWQLAHFDHLAVHVAFELPVSDTRVANLIADIDRVQPPGRLNASTPGVREEGEGVYITVDNLFQNPLPALEQLKPFFDTMSQGVVVVSIRKKGELSGDGLRATLHALEQPLSLCYLRRTAQSPPHLYARWATQSVLNRPASGDNTITSIHDLTGGVLKLVLYPAPIRGDSGLQYFSTLGLPHATVFFNSHECSLAGLVPKLDPATPKQLIYQATLPEAGEILDGTALKGKPYELYY